MGFEVRALNERDFCFGIDKTEDKQHAFRLARAYTKKARTARVMIHEDNRLVFEYVRINDSLWMPIDRENFADRGRRKTAV